MTARMRWRSFRAVGGLSCQIGARIPTTSALVTSETGISPIRGKTWRSRLPIQSCACWGERHPGRRLIPDPPASSSLPVKPVQAVRGCQDRLLDGGHRYHYRGPRQPVGGDVDTRGAGFFPGNHGGDFPYKIAGSSLSEVLASVGDVANQPGHSPSGGDLFSCCGGAS